MSQEPDLSPAAQNQVLLVKPVFNLITLMSTAGSLGLRVLRVGANSTLFTIQIATRVCSSGMWLKRGNYGHCKLLSCQAFLLPYSVGIFLNYYTESGRCRKYVVH
jgi:hypothetical protein